MGARIRIGERTIDARPDETLLEAAERHGVDLPSQCRVGGCGTCKCRLVDGRVEERTETGYLLSREELDQRYVLACQSVPQGEVRIELPPSESRGIGGRIVSQEKVTHDISRVTVRLDAPIAYKSGQFAQLGVARLPGVSRSYSFATPPTDDGHVQFLVRRVPGGRLSTLLNDADLTGEPVRVNGPAGDFWLRTSDAPLLMVAGGSGLAPILAILHDALAHGVARDVTLLFGAREERDLYALEEIEGIARRWKGSFQFVPALSNAAPEAAWQGARGLVTELIEPHLAPGAHAYLCGPPAMVDAALVKLDALGVKRRHVHLDRFTSLADGPKGVGNVAAARDAGPLHYLKYFAFHAIALLSLWSLLGTGAQTTRGLLVVVAAYMLGDAIAGDDTETPRFRHPWVLTAQLWLALPLLAAIVFVSTWRVCEGDPLGFGAWASELLGRDLLAARAAVTFGHHVAGWVLTGLMIGLVGTISAHELTHRTWDRVSMFVGRWLLAFSFDTGFSIEHVYGHHRYVSTTHDPATAPRGRNVYAHVLISTVRGNVSAWRIEAERLARRGLPVWSPRNAFVRGHLMSALLVCSAWAMGGLTAAAYFSACALWGKALLEIVNYMEHYGLVRTPATAVQPRHSWNTNRRVTSWTMFNLSRHSHHHAQGEVPYHALRPYPEAPLMINGYLTTILLTLVPPLWHALMTPRLLAWDRDYASDEERALAAEANARSGLHGLGPGATPGSSRRGAPSLG